MRKKNIYSINLLDNKTPLNVKISYYLGKMGVFISCEKLQDKFPNYIQHNCREIFGRTFTKSTPFFFFAVREGKDISKITTFISIIEGLLKLKNNQRIVFETTNKNNIIKVNVSRWWRSNLLRRQILTAFIRASLLDDNLNYKEKLRKSNYFNGSTHIKAVSKFLKGYTCINPTSGIRMGNKNGWKSIFARKDSDTFLMREGQLS